jgi:hypothetical protein
MPTGVKLRKRRPFLISGIIAGALVLFWLSRFFHWQPGEGTLVRRFEKNRAAFEELRAMSSTNPPVTAVEAVRQGGSAWSAKHYERYSKLLRETGVTRVTQKENEYRFVTVEPPRGKPGVSMAIAWRETAPQRLVSHLKDLRKTSNEPEQGYRRLEDNWYLWMQK